MSFVLDASVALAWCSKQEHTPELLKLLDQAKTTTIHVPAIWPVEVSNVLALMRRKSRISATELAQAQTLFSSLDIQVHYPRQASEISAIVHTAITTQLTAYDAEYLALTSMLNLPLATLDASLRQAASPLVTVLP